LDLPINYKDISPQERRVVREEYIRRQDGLCYHCKAPLNCDPPPMISNLPIKKHLFPPAFFNFPIHLHHSHETGLTIGVVHNYCNAVLWQYHGE